ncbi:unnamed protein product [Cyprideis torosa]|uniref:Uncharacterized protein n=1 Tax=Cyprideis torosa TaxID=163714 RepID=A0A7R8ZFJ1_9CRUS|nr:unnamed protein product [Cyprideis torosa]CAG0879241.1 unnamed protein product [Cyprideis torosa]
MPPVVLAMAKVAKDPYLDNSLDSGVDGLRDSPNNSTDDIPSYIIDPTTRTTYLKGKFLGKAYSEHQAAWKY